MASEDLSTIAENDPYAGRRGLKFGQAEGVEPLPRQLQLGELSQAVRVQLMIVILDLHERGRVTNSLSLRAEWRQLLFDLHTEFFEQFPDTLDLTYSKQRAFLTDIIRNSQYHILLGMVQFILTHKHCPNGLRDRVDRALTLTRAAYHVVDGGLVVPKGSEQEARIAAAAFEALRASEFNGARKHLMQAADQLTGGSWAASVRESIHAVEAVAKLLEPSTDTLGPALNTLAKKEHIHRALKDGMSKLYGYTSDEKGIRHSLLEDGDAKVDETDALYMFGACAAFVTYLIGKGRAAGLIN